MGPGDGSVQLGRQNFLAIGCKGRRFRFSPEAKAFGQGLALGQGEDLEVLAIENHKRLRAVDLAISDWFGRQLPLPDLLRGHRAEQREPEAVSRGTWAFRFLEVQGFNQRRHGPLVVAVAHQRCAHRHQRAHLPLALDRAVVPLLLEVVEDAPEQESRTRSDEAERPQKPHSTFKGVESPHRPAVGQGEKVMGHLGRGAVTQAHIALAGLDEHLVEFQKLLGETGLVGQGGEVVAVFARDELIQHLAQAVEVALDAVGTFWSDETGRADIGVGLGDGRHQADVGELGLPADEHHVGRLDVAVDEVLGMQELEGLRERQTDLDRLVDGQGSAGGQITGQGTRAILFGNDVLAVDRVVGQLHDVVEEVVRRAPADLKDIDERLMDSGDGFESLDALVLAFERACMVEPSSGNDLDRSMNAQDRTGQPHDPVAAGADGPDQLMVGNAGAWLVRRHRDLENGRSNQRPGTAWVADLPWMPLQKCFSSLRKSRSRITDSLE